MKPIDNRPKAIFCDIDGTLVQHSTQSALSDPDYVLSVLPGTIERLLEWDLKGYFIVLTTGRKESLRSATEKQLSRAGIFYDQLIMGIGGGTRIMINDFKAAHKNPTAIAICVDRNIGIKDIEL